MSYVQCKTYKQRNECAKYNNKKLSIFIFIMKNLLKRPCIQKEKTY